MDSEDRFFPFYSQQSSNILKTCCQRRVHMHIFFPGKRKYFCYMTDCHLQVQLDCASPECNFLPSGLRKTECHDDVQGENFVPQNQILGVIYAQMCIIRTTDTGISSGFSISSTTGQRYLQGVGSLCEDLSFADTGKSQNNRHDVCSSHEEHI